MSLAASDTNDGVLDLESRTWLRRHLDGDLEAFPRLIKALQRPIYGYLRRCGLGPALADDLFQDIFLKVHLAAASYQPQRPLKPWVFTIAVNTVRNHFRSRKNQPFAYLDSERLGTDAPGPARQLEGERLLAWTQAQIGELAEIERDVLLLAGIRGLSLQHISDITNLRLNTVKSHLHRARLKLSERLLAREAEQ